MSLVDRDVFLTADLSYIPSHDFLGDALIIYVFVTLVVHFMHCGYEEDVALMRAFLCTFYILTYMYIFWLYVCRV